MIIFWRISAEAAVVHDSLLCLVGPLAYEDCDSAARNQRVIMLQA
jgi:hypothetical protein